MDLTGKNVYISGGSSGIGLACARFAAARGAHVVLFARDPQRLAAAEVTVRAVATPGADVTVLSLDVSDHAACSALLGAACDRYGGPDIVINSAGAGGAEYFERESFEAFERRVRVNLYGVRNVIAATLPAMKPGAHIVNIASMAGLLGVFGFTSYGAAKAAVVGLSSALRAELRFRNIRVSVYCPPDVDTPMLAAGRENKPIETQAISQGGGLISADEAAAALFAGLGSRRLIVIPGFKNRLVYLLSRLAPGVVEGMLHRRAARARRQGAEAVRSAP